MSDSVRLPRLEKRTHHERRVRGLVMGAAAAALVLLLWHGGLLQSLEWITWQGRVRLLARPVAATRKVKLIVIDNTSLAAIEKKTGQSWPWPRQFYQPILAFCKEAGAKAFVCDLFFEQNSVYGPGDDAIFAEAIAKGPPFAIALPLDRKRKESNTWPSALRKRMGAVSLQLDGVEKTGLDGQSMVHYRYASFPIPIYQDQIDLLGAVTFPPDSDGQIRRAPLFSRFQGETVPSLGLAGWLVAGPIRSAVYKDNSLKVQDRQVPLDQQEQMILRFRGPAGTHQCIPADAVIQSYVDLKEGRTPPVSPETFRDCYVVLGNTTQGGGGGYDIKSTPVGSRYPGPEINATVLDNLLSGDFLRDVPEEVTWLTVFALSMVVGLLGVALRNAWENVLTFVIVMAVLWCVSLLLYEAGWWWPLTVHAGGVALTMASAVVLNYATEGKQRRFIKSAFSHYLSPDVIERLLADPGKLALGGERRCLTIFFSDLEGFTSISEKMEPQELTSLLNEYLSDMTDIILAEGGTLDKYEGDAIIAFWNAPVSLPDHALRGVRAALRCQRKLAERRGEFERRYGAELYMRIGMHTGDVVVGNMGSQNRFDYTMLGDAANLAARLEGANKRFGTYTMISRATLEAVKDNIHARLTGAIRVVGRKEPVYVYLPYGFVDEPADETAQGVESGIHLAMEGKTEEALHVFARYPQDPTATRYAEHCRLVMSQKNGRWDGVWNLMEK